MRPLLKREWADVARWSGCFVAALLIHGAGAAAILAHWDTPDAGVNVQPIMLDLGPIEAAPQVAPSNAAPPEDKKEEEPEPEKPVTDVKPEEPLPPPLPAAAIELPTPPPPEKPKPKDKPKQERRAKLTPSSTPSAERQGAQATSPLEGAHGRDSRAEQLWNQALIAQIKSHVGHAPANQTGTAMIGFSVNRSGGLINARLERSSGSDALDRAGLDIVRRAAPFPPPPPEVSGTAIQRTVPIRFR